MSKKKKLGFRKISGRIIDLQEYRYVRLRTYKVEGYDLQSLDENKIISKLINHPIYNDWLVGPEEKLDEGNVDPFTGNTKNAEAVLNLRTHGPFRLDKIQPGHYVSLSLSELFDRIEDHFRDPFYLEQDGPVPEEARREVRLFLDRFDPEEVRCYFLNLEFNPSNETYRQEFEPEVVVHSDFYEYVLIEPGKNRLYFLIVGFD